MLDINTVKSYLVPDINITVLPIATVTPSVIHSIVVTSKPVEHSIDTVSPTVSGVWMELT